MGIKHTFSAFLLAAIELCLAGKTGSTFGDPGR
jgi:hypothetical protein